LEEIKTLVDGKLGLDFIHLIHIPYSGVNKHIPLIKMHILKLLTLIPL